MDHYEFYKELYHKENDRRQEVTNSLGIPIAIITALATALYLLSTSFSYRVSHYCSYLFIALLCLDTLFLLLSIFYLTWAFVDFSKAFEYSGIPYPGSLFEWHQDLEKYYQENYGDLPIDELNQMADKHLKRYLIEEYIKHINHNMLVNDQKYARIFNSKKYLTICLIGCILTLFPFFYGFSNREDDIQKVEITNLIPGKNTNSDNQSKTNSAHVHEREQSKTTPTAPTTKQVNKRGERATPATATKTSERIKANEQRPKTTAPTTPTKQGNKGQSATNSSKTTAQ